MVARALVNTQNVAAENLQTQRKHGVEYSTRVKLPVYIVLAYEHVQTCSSS